MKGASLRDGADGLPKGYARMQVEGRGVMCDLTAARALVHSVPRWRTLSAREVVGRDLLQKHDATLWIFAYLVNLI